LKIPTQVTRHPRSVGGSPRNRHRSARVVHQLLRSSIKAGLLHEGESLSEESLVEQLHTTRASVRFALQLLAGEGLVTRQRRIGTVVRGKAIQIPVQDVVDEKTSGPLDYRLIGDNTFPAHVLIRSRMPTDREQLRMIEYVISSAGTPVGALVAFQINPHARTFVHNPDVSDIATTFEAIYGRPFGRMDTWIDAVEADEPTADLLGISPGAGLLVRDQILSDADGEIHEFAYAHYRADMVSFHS
jgi:GntR family transcriptional regulator